MWDDKRRREDNHNCSMCPPPRARHSDIPYISLLLTYFPNPPSLPSGGASLPPSLPPSLPYRWSTYFLAVLALTSVETTKRRKNSYTTWIEGGREGGREG